MPKNYTVKPNQSMPDVIVQATGSMEAGMQFCNDNGVGINDIPGVNTVYTVSDAALGLGNAAVLRELAKNGTVIGTLNIEGMIRTATITIDHTLCGARNSENFVFHFTYTNDLLRSVAHGGYVANVNGYDIGFYDVDGVKLSWEVMKYVAEDGHITAYVRVPVLSGLLDTVIYMRYGDPRTTTFQGGTPWGNDMVAVHHFEDRTTLNGIDSSAYGNDATVVAATAVSGIEGDGYQAAASFNGSGYIKMYASESLLGMGTWSGWIKSEWDTSDDAFVWGKSGPYGIFLLLKDRKLRVRVSSPGPSTIITMLEGTIDVASHVGWMHVAVMMQGTTCSLFVNGVLDVTGTIPLTSLSDTVFRFGKDVAGDYDGYVGKMDEWRWSRGNRTAAWLTAEYNNMMAEGFYSVEF